MEQYNKDYQSGAQTTQTNSTGQNPPPVQPVYQQSAPEKMLRKGTLMLSIVAMVTSYIALFKRLFGKK